MNGFDCFQYLDAGQLLKDAFAFKKRLDKKFTYQRGAGLAGLKSPGNFSDLVQGRVEIPVSLGRNLAMAMGFNKQETAYFEGLVRYNRSKSLEEKEKYFFKVLKVRQSKLKTLEKSQYEYFNKWYYLAIRELLDFTPFKDDYEGLSKKLVPEVTIGQVKKAIQVLDQLGLIQKDPKGFYHKSETVITAGDWRSLALAGLQKSLTSLIHHSFDQVPASDRAISNLTLSVSKETALRIKEEMAVFRRRLLDLARQDEHADRVYQINLSAFPLSVLPEWGGET